MARRIIRLTDETGISFNLNAAKVFKSGYEWDGWNQVSKATGKRFVHEALYRTAKGRWVIHRWYDWQNAKDEWELISEKEAMEWIRKNCPTA